MLEICEEPDLLSQINKVFVLSGGVKLVGDSVIQGPELAKVKEIPPGARLVPTGFGDYVTKGFFVWGEARVVAAATFGLEMPDCTIYTLSRSPNNWTPMTDAEIYAEEIRRRGFNGKIETRAYSYDTLTELLEIAHLCQVDNDPYAVAITVEPQFRRIKAMWESIENINQTTQHEKINNLMIVNRTRFPENTAAHDYFDQIINDLRSGSLVTQLSVVPAEMILPALGSGYERFIKSLETSPSYRTMIDMEHAAMLRWVKGTYTEPTFDRLFEKEAMEQAYGWYEKSERHGQKVQGVGVFWTKGPAWMD